MMKFQPTLDRTRPTEEKAAGMAGHPGQMGTTGGYQKLGNTVAPRAVLMRGVYSSEGVGETKDCHCGEEFTPW